MFEMEKLDVNDERVLEGIQSLISACGGAPESFDGELVTQMIQTSLKLMIEGHDTGQLKLITRALKEMRHAYRVFNKYGGTRRISIFGSARTPEEHPDYQAAKKFSGIMGDLGWMCITGAANGIMKAGLEGPKQESRIGLSIRLPFEDAASTAIDGDPKLMVFRYFFTRKLMFISHSDAVAVFPGGYGTLDELFEVLTLIQTGKANIIPVVLLEGGDGVYWQHWQHYVDKHLLGNGWISPRDTSLFYIAKSVEDGVQHVQQFYSRYHSSRYVKEELVIRMNTPLTQKDVDLLNSEFSPLVKGGEIRLTDHLEGEDDFLDLPRIAFRHTRRDIALLRLLIDRINSF